MDPYKKPTQDTLLPRGFQNRNQNAKQSSKDPISRESRDKLFKTIKEKPSKKSPSKEKGDELFPDEYFQNSEEKEKSLKERQQKKQILMIIGAFAIGCLLTATLFFLFKGPAGVAILEQQKENLQQEHQQELTEKEQHCQEDIKKSDDECQQKITEKTIKEQGCNTELAKTTMIYGDCKHSNDQCQNNLQVCTSNVDSCKKEKDACIQNMNNLISQSNSNLKLLADACNEKMDACKNGEINQLYLNIADFILNP